MVKFSTKMVLTTLIIVPVASFAQSGQQMSRAQVRAELTQVEKAGYDPHDWVHYPENIQAAQAKVAAQNATAQGAGSGYGGAVDGTSGTVGGR
ncbi:DUF4148 domain-containing protein [Paraburkholderia terrae]